MIIRCSRCGLEIMTKPDEKVKRCPRCGNVESVPAPRHAAEPAGAPEYEPRDTRRREENAYRRVRQPSPVSRFIRAAVPVLLLAVIIAGLAVIYKHPKPEPKPAAAPAAAPASQPSTFGESGGGAVDAAYVSVGNCFDLGKYELDDDPVDGLESLGWIVLDIQGDRMLLLSEYALAGKPYNDVNTAVTWSECTLRNWLNSDFYDAAFDDFEKSAIIPVNHDAGNNFWYESDSGSVSEDRVFLLSMDEAQQYLTDELLLAVPTWTMMNEGSPNTGGCRWWLRTPGQHNDLASIVTVGGYDYVGFPVDSDFVAVRPAVWVRITTE